MEPVFQIFNSQSWTDYSERFTDNRNENLRKILSKGPNYREPKTIN